MALAAVLGEEGHEPAGAFEIDGVEDLPHPPPRAQQPGALQLRQVMRQRRGRHADPLGDFSRRQAVRPLADQQAEHREPVFMGQRRQRRDGVFFFHNSKIIEISNAPQAPS